MAGFFCQKFELIIIKNRFCNSLSIATTKMKTKTTIKNFASWCMLLTILVAPHLAISQSARTANEEEKQKFLEIHNAYRQEVGVPGLVWDDSLAEYAREWANQLKKKHNCWMTHRPRYGKYKQKYGENIFILRGGEPEIEEVMKSWGSEKKDYNGEPLGQVKSSNPTGHYTQIIWSRTKRLGCARIKCSKDEDVRCIWVCNYDPPGNYRGQRPYKE